MAAFPENIACITTTNYKEGFPETTLYLGNRVRRDNPTAIVNVVISNHTDMQTFVNWYKNDIAYGVSQFTINIPLFGTKKDWNVRLTKKLEASLLENSNKIRGLTLELEILDTL